MSARALRSRRFVHERTGQPMPAYVFDGYVAEKARREWNHRVAGQSAAMWAGPKEWWEVRRQGARTQLGVSVGPKLFEADTLRECRAWIRSRSAR